MSSENSPNFEHPLLILSRSGDRQLQDLAEQLSQQAGERLDTLDQNISDRVSGTLSDPRVRGALLLLANYSNENALQSASDGIEDVLSNGEAQLADNMSQILSSVIAGRYDLSEDEQKGLEKFIKDPTPIKDDMKRIWKKHVGFLIEQYKEERKEGKARKVGAFLSFAGKAWDAVSDFWDEFHSKHVVLAPVDKLLVKPLAISLYTATIPALSIIKGLELVGRTITEYSKRKSRGETKLLLPSIVKSSKQVGASILKHFLRVAVGNSANPAIKAFYEKLGIGEELAKTVLQAVTSPDLMKYLEQLSPEQAHQAAGQVGELLISHNQPDAAMIARFVIPAVLNNLKDEQINKTVDALRKGEILDALKNSPEPFKNAVIEKITKVVSEKADIDLENLIKNTKDALSKDDITLDLDGFKKFVQENNPDLHKSLESSYNKLEGKENIPLKDFESLFGKNGELKKLKKSLKKELREFATEYAVQKTLNHIPELKSALDVSPEKPDEKKSQAKNPDNLEASQSKKRWTNLFKSKKSKNRQRSKSLSHLDRERVRSSDASARSKEI